MADCRDNLALLPERVYQLGVIGITGQIQNGPMTTDVEDSDIVVSLDISKNLRVLQFLNHDVIFEKGYRLVVRKIL